MCHWIKVLFQNLSLAPLYFFVLKNCTPANFSYKFFKCMTFGLCTSGVTANLCGFWLPAFPSPFWVCASVSMGSGEYFPLNFLQCDGASWRLHAGVVPTRGVAMGTSLLSLRRLCPRPTFKAPVPKLILEMSLIIISQISESF